MSTLTIQNEQDVQALIERYCASPDARIVGLFERINNQPDTLGSTRNNRSSWFWKLSAMCWIFDFWCCKANFPTGVASAKEVMQKVAPYLFTVCVKYLPDHLIIKMMNKFCDDISETLETNLGVSFTTVVHKSNPWSVIVNELKVVCAELGSDYADMITKWESECTTKSFFAYLRDSDIIPVRIITTVVAIQMKLARVEVAEDLGNAVDEVPQVPDVPDEAPEKLYDRDTILQFLPVLFNSIKTLVHQHDKERDKERDKYKEYKRKYEELLVHTQQLEKRIKVQEDQGFQTFMRMRREEFLLLHPDKSDVEVEDCLFDQWVQLPSHVQRMYK